jgi:hypothetical protein
VTNRYALIKGIGFVLWSEERAKIKTAQTRSKKDEVKFRNRLCALLVNVRLSGDMNLITQTDKLINQNDLEKYATSKRQVSSLQNGLDDLTAIEIGIECLRDTETYKKSSVAYFQQKVYDSQGLPKDPARLAFRSHLTRLENLDASKVDESEKAVLKERMLNIRAAERLYIEKQREVLGMDKAVSPKARGVTAQTVVVRKNRPEPEPDMER